MLQKNGLLYLGQPAGCIGLSGIETHPSFIHGGENRIPDQVCIVVKPDEVQENHLHEENNTMMRVNLRSNTENKSLLEVV